MRVIKPHQWLVAAFLFLAYGGILSAQPPSGPPADLDNPGASMSALTVWLEKAYAGSDAPESVRMLMAIARGSQMGPTDGWFGPAQTRYTWDWLVRLHGKESATGITREKFRGVDSWFARLDRDRDGRITAEDLDWSDNSPYIRQLALARQIARAIDRDGNSKMTAAEWEAFFKKMAKDKGHITPEDLRDALFPPPTQPDPSKMAARPTPEILLKGLFNGELGSLLPGPNVGQEMPDFTLKTNDGKQSYSLSQWKGKKPIVLVFGSFT